ncbi:MAG: hypothetical protein U0289_09745 [Cyclobacteriaceae bacterium]|nr:hypothetical protein [Cyclobacteriaceae bacterium]
MCRWIFVVMILFAGFSGRAQEAKVARKFYVIWGWNRASYTNSDIRFHGNSYDFTLSRAVAHDRQTPIAFDPYLSPGRITIPQTNFRIGYYLNDHWSITAGVDHMKYVMDQDQTVNIDGYIQNSQTPYDGTYPHTPIKLTEDFLTFEHTDGLNYINIEIRRHDQLLHLNRPDISVNLIEGFGAGALLPKTNTQLLLNNRYDEFHLAGYGVSAMAGINLTFFKYFFLQSEVKGGYINMPDIRTTEFSSDRAKQHFFFDEWTMLFGVNFFVPGASH